MKKNLIRILFGLFIPIISYSVPAQEYVSDNSDIWDRIAGLISQYILEGIGQMLTVVIVMSSILFAIQLALDMANGMANGNIQAMLSAFFKRIIGFTFHLSIVTQIFNGKIVELAEDVAYGVIRAVSSIAGVPKISNIWLLKEHIVGSIWQSISEIRWIFINRIGNNLITLFFFLFLIIVFNIAIFIMVFNLFKALISFQIALGLSTILLPLGLLDVTKGYYNIGKILSLSINFIIKLVSVNVMVLFVEKLMRDGNIFNFQDLSMSNMFDVSQNLELMSMVIVLFVIQHLFTKMEVSF